MTIEQTSALRRSRGMRDLLPDDMRAFRRCEDAFRAAATRWGYEEIRTPTLETYSLFTLAGGLTPEMLARVYSFLDWDGWSGERVVLRPDSTIPVARAAVEAGLAMPARLFYTQSRFRFVESGDREDWQFGLEFLGAQAASGDLEVVTVACEAAETLGLHPTVHLSHVGFAQAVRAHLSGREATDGADLTALRSRLPAGSPIAPLLDSALRPAQGPNLARNLLPLAQTALPSAAEALQELDGVARALAESDRRVVVDLDMPVDFEYYTGVVYELEVRGARLGAGGRYAPSWTGTASTACGLALEVMPLIRLGAEGVSFRPAVSVVPARGSDFGRAVAVANVLHRGGVAASLDREPSGPVAVRVDGDRLVAVTAEGEHVIDALDGLVTLLAQTK